MGSFVSSNGTGTGEAVAYLNGTDLVLHPHWKLYEEELLNVPPLYHYLIGIYIAVVGIVGTLGNALVIYIFATTKSLRTPPNMFIINLALSDMGFSAINGFPLMTVSCFLKKWSFGMLACELYGALGGLFGFNSIGTLAWISVDRYYVIAYPFDAMRKCTHTRALIQILFVWLWSALLSIPPLFGWGRYLPDGLHTYCSFDYLTQSWPIISHVWAMVGLGLVVPVLLCLVCYVNIVRAVTAQNKSMSKAAETMKAKEGNARNHKQEIELAKVAAINVTLFLIAWTPYAIICVLGILGYWQYVTPYSAQIPVLVAKASAVWNPLLYSLNHPRYRAALRERFPWLLPLKGKEEKRDAKEAKKNPKEMDSEDLSDGDTSVDPPPVSTVPTGPTFAQLRTQMEQQRQVAAYTNPAFQPDHSDGVVIGPQNFPCGVPTVAYIPYPAPPAAHCPGHCPGHAPSTPCSHDSCTPCPHASPSRRRPRSESGSDEGGYDLTDSTTRNKERMESEVATEPTTKAETKATEVTKVTEDGGEV